MAKTGPLSDLEKFWIEEKRSSTDVDAIAKKLDRSKTSINNFLKKLDAVGVEVQNDYKVGDPIPSQNNPVVMTEGMSQLGDLIYEKGKTVTSRMSNCITSSKQR